MQILDKLLSIDPNYLFIGLMICFYLMEMAFSRPVPAGTKFNHLFQNFLFQLFAIAMASIVGLIVTPNYHKVHHEQDQNYTDSNYGSLFIVWDKLFGTFMSKPVGDIKYGLAEFEDAGKQSFLFLIVSLFIRLKPPVENY